MDICVTILSALIKGSEKAAKEVVALTRLQPKTDITSQGVKLRPIQAPVRLNFSLWRPSPGK